MFLFPLLLAIRRPFVCGEDALSAITAATVAAAAAAAASTSLHLVGLWAVVVVLEALVCLPRLVCLCLGSMLLLPGSRMIPRVFIYFPRSKPQLWWCTLQALVTLVSCESFVTTGGCLHLVVLRAHAASGGRGLPLLSSYTYRRTTDEPHMITLLPSYWLCRRRKPYLNQVKTHACDTNRRRVKIGRHVPTVVL